jgi:hypothetical protein
MGRPSPGRRARLGVLGVWWVRRLRAVDPEQATLPLKEEVSELGRIMEKDEGLFDVRNEGVALSA